MLTDVYLFTGIVALGAVVICVTVWRLERWLIWKDKRPPRHYRAGPAKEKLVDPVAVRKCTVRPEDKTA